ncbi:unnamed protein product [Prorocentrum cordatum]|uniref:Uncharacterized protein n=1 Tax=Prorocentrum cordatum TaxID=2364126 RepID=A0ABN9Q7W6_9DINO|nr:unnamed protein product [Polarella glacialis]
MALIPGCHLSTSKSLDRLRALSNKNSSKRWVRLVSASTTACEDEDFGSMMGEFSESDDDEDLEPSWSADDEDLEPNWSADVEALEPDAADDGEALEPDAADRCDTSPLDSLLRRTRRCSAALRGTTDGLALGQGATGAWEPGAVDRRGPGSPLGEMLLAAKRRSAFACGFGPLRETRAADSPFCGTCSRGRVAGAPLPEASGLSP